MNNYKSQVTLLKFMFLFVLAINTTELTAQTGYGTKLGNNQYRRAAEGGGAIVVVDTTKNLEDLILELDDRWEFEFTGKAYWIGYTDLMYAIAHHKQLAIPLLLNHYTKTKSTFGKEGVIYTLHLIGIHSTVAGRFYEKFIDTLARKALLDLLLYNQHNTEIASLLWRDPWLSDIRFFKENLSKIKFSTEMNNLLARYKLTNKPLNGVLPTAKYSKVEIYYQSKDSIMFIGNIFNYCNSSSLNKIENDSTTHCYLGKYHCFDIITTRHESFKKIMDNYFSHDRMTDNDDFIEYLFKDYCKNSMRLDPFTFCGITNPIYYISKGSKITLLQPELATEVWLEYMKS
jgi:hypothetical protein